jgi:hypothetical protein
MFADYLLNAAELLLSATILIGYLATTRKTVAATQDMATTKDQTSCQTESVSAAIRRIRLSAYGTQNIAR